ncbi:hypothetical protein BJ986_001870 [Phycicoccus badiiscoriae]|uniref:Capsular polysaccharide biosynthesis protein n=1 Tax=Pedococcus badiiscoriae TaxID=642776 RepID=A0A852WDV0_9MICO|nr:hypothetical protein [Pedococcus badiiscoriae]NYG07383.1 hypothetical protein [Pedococcus badiiscoriae]
MKKPGATVFLSEIWSSMRRRWYLLILGVLASLGLAVGTGIAVGPKYTLVSEVLLMPPASSTPGRSNPYLILDGLSPAVDVVSLAAVDPAMLEKMRAEGLDAEVLVERDILSPAPLAKVTVTATTPSKALTAQDIMLKQLPGTVAQLQSSAGIVASQQITTSVIVAGSKPATVRKGQVRYALAALIVGGATTFMLIGGLDVVLTRRRQRRLDSVPASGPVPSLLEDHPIDTPPTSASETAPKGVTGQGRVSPQGGRKIAASARGSAPRP